MKRSIFFFTANRYFIYAGQFIRGMLLAKILGPELFGVWGFLNLIQQYLTYTNFGVQYALNVEISTTRHQNPQNAQEVFSASLTITIGSFLFLLIMGTLGSFGPFNIFQQYSFPKYSLLVFLYAAFLLVLELLGNIFRLYNKLLPVALAELLSTIIPFSAFFIYPSEDLVYGMFVMLNISTMLSVIILLWLLPVRVALTTNRLKINEILQIGFPLLIYNVSYYILLVSGRTIIGLFYGQEIMGYYSFSYSLTNAILLGINAVSWVILPDVLSKLRNGLHDDEVFDSMKRIGLMYSLAVFGTILIALVCIPIIFVVLDKYKPAWDIITILLLMQSTLSFSFVAISLAMARKKNYQLSIIAFVGIIFTLLISYFVYTYQLDFLWIAIGGLGGAIIFTCCALLYALRLINKRLSLTLLLESLTPFALFTIILIPLIGILVNQRVLFNLSSLLIFFIVFHNNIFKMFKTVIFNK